MPGVVTTRFPTTLTTVFIGLLARYGPFWPCCGLFLLLFKDFGGILLIRLSRAERVQVGECSQFNGLDEGQINSLQIRTRLSRSIRPCCLFQEVSSIKKGRNLFFLQNHPRCHGFGISCTWADTTLCEANFCHDESYSISSFKEKLFPDQPTSSSKFSLLLGLVLFEFVVSQQQSWLNLRVARFPRASCKKIEKEKEKHI